MAMRGMNLVSMFTAAVLMAQLAPAQAPAPGGAAATQPAAGAARSGASKDPAAAPAGNYTVDLRHSSVVARVIHNGLSFNVLRFGVKQGSLAWDPANPANNKLDVTVTAKTHTDPVVYIVPPEGAQYLDSAKHPEIRFVSNAVRATGGGKYEIDGDLTLMGVTKPAKIQASFVGTSSNGMTMGFTGSMDVEWKAFNPASEAQLGIVAVQLDAEFKKS